MKLVECIKCGRLISDDDAVEVYSCPLGSDYVCKHCYNPKKGCIEVLITDEDTDTDTIKEVDNMEEALEITKKETHCKIFIDNVLRGRYYNGEKI